MDLIKLGTEVLKAALTVYFDKYFDIFSSFTSTSINNFIFKDEVLQVKKWVMCI